MAPLLAQAIAVGYAFPHEDGHERARQPGLAECHKRPRRRVGQFELVVEDEMRQDHLHEDRYVEARRAIDSRFCVSQDLGLKQGAVQRLRCLSSS